MDAITRFLLKFLKMGTWVFMACSISAVAGALIALVADIHDVPLRALLFMGFLVAYPLIHWLGYTRSRICAGIAATIHGVIAAFFVDMFLGRPEASLTIDDWMSLLFALLFASLGGVMLAYRCISWRSF
jgi:hypothetical protein